MRATSLGGRRFVEDKKLGYAISFSENWTQLIANPEEGHILSLGIIDEDFVASVDVFVFEDWDPSLSLYDLASYLNPADEGARVEPLQEIEISGKRGLFRVYHDEQEQIIGHQYFVASGSRLMVMTAWAIEGLYDDFAEEFEAIATSFQFLEE